ncbi:hypothetical protein F2Q69_00029111 [Brassica cretica]|uniref:Uncharacterized protein n=1 Tax=Brassica cretica TaxID=69181 RepID=A0A8S9RSJ8_BRACR|nr:hypothetical protein F2Q69_00029111 [Brassica cretica]
MNTESVELTYSLQQMAPDLPPIHVTSDRQVRNLLEITKTHESRHANHKTDHKQNYYRSFLYKDKLRLHLIWKKTLSEDFQEVQTTYRRLPGSPDDFQEVKMTSRKSRRLPGSQDDFQEVQTTEMEVVWKTSWKSSSALYFRRLTDKSSHKSSRSEKSAYQIHI